MSRKILGLDIRDNSLSAVLINGTLQGNHIEVFEFIDFQGVETGGAVSEDTAGEETRAEDLKETFDALLFRMLAKVSETIDIAGCACIVSLPASFISYRNIRVPFRNEKKIRQVIHFELEPVMPGSVENLVIDFKLLESTDEGGESVLVTASTDRTHLETLESCLQNSGFDVQAVLPGGSAAADYLLKTSDPDEYLFADVDGATCTLFAVQSREVVFIRSFPVKKENIKALGLDIKRTLLSFCEQYEVDYEPGTVFVSGSFFQEPSVAAGLSDETGLKTEVTDFCESTGFLIDSQLKTTWNPALYDNALALAYNALFGISGLRFSERFFAVGKYFTEHKKQIINAGILLLCVIIAGLGNIGFSAYTVGTKMKAADSEMKAIYRGLFPDAKVISNPYGQLKGKVKEARQNSAFQDKSSGNIRVIDMLNEISKKLPNELDIEFTRFVLGTENLKISGDADAFASVDKMKKELEKIDFFKKVVISSTTNNQSGEGVRFKLKIDF